MVSWCFSHIDMLGSLGLDSQVPGQDASFSHCLDLLGQGMPILLVIAKELSRGICWLNFHQFVGELLLR